VKYSDLEKQAWKDKMRMVSKRVKALSPEEREAMSRRYPIVTCEGHTLSVHNQCMLILQNPFPVPITIVAGYKQWGKAGRTVRRGEHACGYIMVPMGGNKTEHENRPPTFDRSGNDDIHFRFVPVFDVTQTDSTDGREFKRGDNAVKVEVQEAIFPALLCYT